MTKIKPKSNFFLYKILGSESKLDRDEPSIISRILWMTALILLIIDLLVFLFFVITMRRIKAVEEHNFTQDIIESIRTSTETHSKYASYTKAEIEKLNLNIRTAVATLEKSGSNLSSYKPQNFDEKELDELKQAIDDLDKKDIDPKKSAARAKELFERVNKKIEQYIHKNEQIFLFNQNVKNVENLIDDLIKNIKKNLDNFLTTINGLSKEQHQNQKQLYIQMHHVLDDFYKAYVFVYENNNYKSLNNFYKTEFYEFENDYIPFVEDRDNEYHKATLSRTADFQLRLSRVYFCNLGAFVRGMGNFNVKFEYVDYVSKNEEVIVASTKDFQGNFKEPISVNQLFTFTLDKGNHYLSLRAISEGISSQIHMRDLTLECVSYRNFHPYKKKSD